MKTVRTTKSPRVIRRAFTLRLKPGAYTLYKYYHDRIWPELVREIEASGIAQITTFRDDLQLFLYSEIYDPKAWDKLWNSKAHDDWAQHMEPLMQFGADGKVDAGPLEEIFHLATAAGRRRRQVKPQPKPRKKSKAKAA